MSVSDAWKNIPGWSGDIECFYADLATKIPQGGTFVEVGVLFGRSLACMGDLRPDLDLWAVDLWQESSALDCFAEVAAKYPTTWQGFLGLMAEHAPDVLKRVHVIRAPSTSVTLPMADVVFIDANHEYEFVRDDIIHWSPGVKPGGWLCGHDYLAPTAENPGYPGVIRAVDEKLGKPNMGPGDWTSCWWHRQWTLR
jgi:hypothetical protein